MMLALALLLAQAGATAAPAEDIVVFGERLDRLRFSARVDRRGRVRCRVTRSSGDAAFDGIVCDAVRDCAGRRLGSQAEVESCLQERLRARFDALQAQEEQP